MIRAAQPHEERVYGPVDYVLTGVYACLAAYATGVSVGSPAAAWMFVAVIAVGTLFSFAVQWLIGDQPVVRYDGIMYLLVGIATFFFKEDLSKMVPDQPFVDQLQHTGTLCWLLALGSFFTWRDGTLLFQAVPSIALFGMVGAFDTYKAAPFLFFAFLVCLATLFARAHRRQMIEQAEASGYKAMLAQEEASGAQKSKVAGGGARLQAILEGPWKWMAGPEWALASALAIVCISLAGAPALRIVLKPIEGSIHIPPPPLTQAATQALFGGLEGGRVAVGTGPRTRFANRPMIIADTGDKRYLRERTYAVYSGLGWEAGLSQIPANSAGAGVPALTDQNAERVRERSVREIKHPIDVPFKIILLIPGASGLPVPGDVKIGDRGQALLTASKDETNPLENPDGTFRTNLEPGTPAPVYSGTVETADPKEKPVDAVHNFPDGSQMFDYTDTTNIPPQVVTYAKEVTKDAKTDFDKAMAIQGAIESKCVYDLSAPATPGGQDPVAYFLFTSHRGYCDLFGSAMTLMARAVGIPARYSTGFYPINGTHAPPPNEAAWEMTDAEAHAWSELFFQDVGWVDFDPTEGAASAPGEGRGQVGATWYNGPWVKGALDGAIFLLLLGGGLIAFLSYRKAEANRIPSRQDVGREYARFVIILQRLSGRRRLPSQTPNEFLAANERLLGSYATDAEKLNGRFVEALYSPMEINPGILSELRSGTETLRQKIKANGKPAETAGTRS